MRRRRRGTNVGELVQRMVQLSALNKSLNRYKVVVTAGPTHEMIDPVRYITNRSSGRMGFALAQAAAELGADVQQGPSRWKHRLRLKDTMCALLRKCCKR